jgi:pimeloyl-ACP methyl ester carboxylesterase
MRNAIVILHGWSDNSRSFRVLAQLLQAQFGAAVQHLYLADWLSMQDDISYGDLSLAMQQAWLKMQLPTTPQSVDLVVHSTGALVARHWFTRYYSAASNPVKRFLQLAPANFGSPLAHKGRSFVGRAIKGWQQPDFQTGANLLYGLELASEYSLELAKADLFASEPWYGANRMLSTVLMGNRGYSGISAIANEAGSDGTVRIAGANFNCRYLKLALDERQNVKPGSLRLFKSQGEIAFSVLPGEHHGSIIGNGKNAPHNPRTLQFIRQALSVEDADFEANKQGSFAFQQHLDGLNPPANWQADLRCQVVCKLHDQHGDPVTDYFLEMYRTASADSLFEQKLYQQFLRHVHPHSQQPQNRAFYFDVQALQALRQTPKFHHLFLSFHAQPVFKKNQQPAGFGVVPASSTAGLRLSVAELEQIFVPHQSLLLDVEMTRQVADTVFTLQRHKA